MNVSWPVPVPQARRSQVRTSLTFQEASTTRASREAAAAAAAAAAASSVESDSVPGLSLSLSLSSGGSDEAGDGGASGGGCGSSGSGGVPVSTESLPLRWSPRAADEGLRLDSSHTPLTGRLGMVPVRSWPAHWSAASRAHSHCCLSCAALCDGEGEGHTCPKHSAYQFLPAGAAGVLRGSLVPRLFLESREYRQRGQVRAAAAAAEAQPSGAAPPSPSPPSVVGTASARSSAAASGSVDCRAGLWEDACLASFEAAVEEASPRAAKRGGAKPPSQAKKTRRTYD